MADSSSTPLLPKHLPLPSLEETFERYIGDFGWVQLFQEFLVFLPGSLMLSKPSSVYSLMLSLPGTALLSSAQSCVLPFQTSAGFSKVHGRGTGQQKPRLYRNGTLYVPVNTSSRASPRLPSSWAALHGWWTRSCLPRPPEHVILFVFFNVGCWDFNYFLSECLDLLRAEIPFHDRDMCYCVIDGARRKTVARPGWGNWFLPFHIRVLDLTSHSLSKQRFLMEISLSLDFPSGTVVFLSSPFLCS